MVNTLVFKSASCWDTVTNAQNIKRVSEDDLVALIQNKGEVHFICGGWQCQSMSMAGPKT